MGTDGWVKTSMATSLCHGIVWSAYAGTPLARISHRQLIDKLYAFLTAFLQLRYKLSVMSIRSL
jgi:hypothetical protein